MADAHTRGPGLLYIGGLKGYICSVVSDGKRGAWCSDRV
jgi:hypothetical protein